MQKRSAHVLVLLVRMLLHRYLHMHKALRYTALGYAKLHCNTIRALYTLRQDHCTEVAELRCVALHCIALPCIALHYATLP